MRSQECMTGCQKCTYQNNNQEKTCDQCLNGYQLINGNCVYQGCQHDLYFQINENQDNNTFGNCLSICNPPFYSDTQTNTCKELVQCSSIYSTQQNYNDVPLDFFIYKQQYYVALLKDQLSIYDYRVISQIKSLKYQQDDQSVQHVNDLIFIVKKNSTIAVWDIINETRYSFDDNLLILVNQEIQFVDFLNRYLLILQIDSDSIQLQIIYDEINQKQLISNPIQISQFSKNNYVLNNYLFTGNQTSLIIYQINYSSDNTKLNYTQQIIFNFESQGNLNQMLQTQNQSIYFSVFDFGILYIDLFKQKCQFLIKQTTIHKLKIIESEENQKDIHLIILTQENMIDYSFLSNQASTVISDAQNITDFDVGSFTGIQNQIIILNNQQQLQIYKYQNSNLDQPQQIITLNFQSNQLKKMKKQYLTEQAESQTDFELTFFPPNSIYILRPYDNKESILETKIIENFNLIFPTPSSQINSLIIVYQPSILISCHQNGDIIFYESSRGINMNLIQKLSFPDQICIQLHRFYDNRIAAIISQNLILIDTSQQIILSEISNIKNIVQVITNYDKLAIIYDNCVQILSSEFKSLFLECQTEFSSNNNQIALNNDLKVVVQKQQIIDIYQIMLDTQQAQKVSSISTINTIQYFNIIQVFNSDQDTVLNNYIIDEIVFFDSESNFTVCNFSLQVTYVQNVTQLESVVSVLRVENDDAVYFLAGFQIKKGYSGVFLVSKNLDNYLQVSNDNYYPSVQQPRKVVNGYGTVFYSFYVHQQLNFFSLIFEKQVDVNRNITYLTSFEYVNGDSESAYLSKTIRSSQNFQNYIGTQSGLIYTAKQQIQKYKVLEMNNNILSKSQNDDQIEEIIQSAQMDIYFVRTKYQISSFNIFTNQFIELLNPQSSNDKPFSSFSIVIGSLGIVCWNQDQLLLAVYGTKIQKYYYKGMSIINGWFFISSSNQFCIYGSSFIIFSSELQITKVIADEQSQMQFLQCQYTSNFFVCSISINLFVIIKNQVDQFNIQKIQITGFSNQYKIAVDEQQEIIFLYDDQIQVYTQNGEQLVKYMINSQLATFSIANNFILFQSQQYIYFLGRESLLLQENSIKAPSGLNIINYLYIDFLEYIVLYMNNNSLGSIYIYDANSLQSISKITSDFTQNQIGNVLNMYFDYSSAQITYLDTYGNLYVYDLFDEFSVEDIFKISEVYDRNEQLISFSIDETYNNILVYSTNSIYQIDYSLSGYIYEAQLNEPSHLYASILINNQIEIYLEFLFFNQDNVIFRYSNYKIQFESISDGNQIIDITYNQIQDTLIIALKGSIIFQQNYQQSKTNNLIIQQKLLKGIQFFKFLQYNVYLTYDKKVIYCNTQTGEIISTFQLSAIILITEYKCSDDQNIIFLGLSNGSVLQFNLSDLSQQYYTIKNNNQLNSAIISITFDIYKGQKQTAYFASNGGILLVVDIVNKKIIQEINLIELVYEDPSSILSQFTLDQTYSRYIFIFNGQKKAYVWNFYNNKQEQYLILTKDQGNKIQIIQNYLITFCTFQLNIYIISDQISLLTIIKRNLSNDQITDYQVINSTIIIIFFIQKYEVYLLQGNNSNIILQQIYQYPRYLGYIFNQLDNNFKLYGLHQKGVFEDNFNLSMYYQSDQTECSIIINDEDISLQNQKISSIIPKQNLLNTKYGSSTQNQINWMNIIYLQVSDDQFKTVIQYIQQNQLANSLFLFYPQQDNNNITLTSEIFDNLEQETFFLFNYNFIFLENQEQTLIDLNQKVQIISWRNISITDQCVENIQIEVSNIEKVILQSIKISNLNSCRNDSNVNSQQYFFNFYNISQVYIYDLEISTLMLQSSDNLTLFNLNQIETVFIDGAKIINNRNINSLFQFTQINNATLKNTSLKTFQRWKLVQKNLMKIISQKVTQNINIITSRSNFILNSQQSEFQQHIVLTEQQKGKKFSQYSPQILSNQSTFKQKQFISNKKTYNWNTDEGNFNIMSDFVLKSDEVLNEQDPSKVQKYCISPKSLTSKTKQSILSND
ncbi:hypothetical protein ABPG73_012010 [Tetrahymena malaccensis]